MGDRPKSTRQQSKSANQVLAYPDVTVFHCAVAHETTAMYEHQDGETGRRAWAPRGREHIQIEVVLGGSALLQASRSIHETSTEL